MAVKAIGTDTSKGSDDDPVLDSDTVIEELRPRLESAAASCSEKTVHKAPDVLAKRAEVAGEMATRERMNAAIDELRRHPDAIVTRFRTALGEALQRGFGHAPEDDPHATSRDNWRLMDQSEIEEEVAIDRIGGRVRRGHAETVSELERRLGHVVALDESGKDNPFDPATAIRAFAISLRQTGIDVRERMVVYQVFGRELRNALGDVYRALNDTLAEAGLTADWVQATSDSDARSAHDGDAARQPAADRESEAPREHPAAGAQPPAHTEANPPPAAVATTGQLTSQVVPEYLPPEKEVVELLHQLVSSQRGDDSDDTTDAGNKRKAGTKEVTGALTALQRHTSQRQKAPLQASQLKTLLTNGLKRRTGSEGLEASVDQTIDIVSMLFEVILEDERLPGAIEGQFARLQVPVLKIAMMDGDFLANSAHPARRLFNRLARCALTLAGQEDVTSDPTYWNIRGAVEKVIDEFSQDTAVFEAALVAFDTWQWQTGRGSIAEGHAQEGAETRKARAEAVRAHVTDTIEARLAETSGLPDVVAGLLNQAWFKLMFVTGVKHGIDGELWQSQKQVMDSLIWSMSAHEDPIDRAYVAEELPNLLQRIHDELNSIMYNPAAINDFIEELQAAHAAVNPPPSAQELGSEPPSRSTEQRSLETTHTDNVRVASFREAPSDSTEIAESAQDSQASHQEIVQKLTRVPILSWFDIVETNGRRHRACLQARVDDGQTYVFASRHGERVAEYNLDDLARAIADGTAKPIEDGALFDRALENIVTRLRGEADRARMETPPAAAS